MTTDGAGGGRGPGAGVVTGVLLLVASVGGVAWWQSHPAPPPADPAPLSGLDVICTGRVDAAGMVIPLEPLQPGRVVEIAVSEGDAVKKGQAVLRVDDEAARIRLAQATAAVDAAAVELDAAKAEADQFAGRVQAQEHLVVAAGARVEAARKALLQRRDQQALAPLGRFEAEAMEAQIREVEETAAAQRVQLAELRKTDPGLRVRLAAARVAAATADRDLAEKFVRECTLTAPADGKILRLQATVGGPVAAAAPVPPVVFAPAGPLVVRAEVDQEFLGRVKPGMRATVQDENRPDGATWAGTVKSVAGWVAARRAIVLDPGELNDVRTVECVIALDPPAPGLWVGQRMRVRIAPGN